LWVCVKMQWPSQMRARFSQVERNPLAECAISQPAALPQPPTPRLKANALGLFTWQLVKVLSSVRLTLVQKGGEREEANDNCRLDSRESG